MFLQCQSKFRKFSLWVISIYWPTFFSWHAFINVKREIKTGYYEHNSPQLPNAMTTCVLLEAPVTSLTLSYLVRLKKKLVQSKESGRP